MFLLFVCDLSQTDFPSLESDRYDSKVKTHKNRFRHLTNYSLQKNRSSFVQNTDADQDNVGNKWSLRALRAWLRDNGHDDCAVWENIKDVIIKTILTAEPQIATNVQLFVPHRGNCFELLGFDVLLDSQLQPWLMEVNICPALNCDSPLDKKIKSALVTNAFNVIGFFAYDRKSFKDDNDVLKQNRLLGISKNPSAKGSAESAKRRDVLCGRSKALENLSEEDLMILKEAEDEYLRSANDSGFERIFPGKKGLYYDQFFVTRRYNNILLMEWVLAKEQWLHSQTSGDETPSPHPHPPERSSSSSAAQKAALSPKKISATKSISGAGLGGTKKSRPPSASKVAEQRAQTKVTFVGLAGNGVAGNGAAMIGRPFTSSSARGSVMKSRLLNATATSTPPPSWPGASALVFDPTVAPVASETGSFHFAPPRPLSATVASHLRKKDGNGSRDRPGSFVYGVGDGSGSTSRLTFGANAEKLPPLLARLSMFEQLSLKPPHR